MSPTFLIYIGITNSFERRAAEHLRQRGLVIEKIKGLNTLSRDDARSVEQTLIEFYALGKDGGTLLNRINSISRNNDKYEDALRRGREILRIIGMSGI